MRYALGKYLAPTMVLLVLLVLLVLIAPWSAPPQARESAESMAAPAGVEEVQPQRGLSPPSAAGRLRLLREVEAPRATGAGPDTSRALPYDYGKVVVAGAPALRQLPTAAERRLVTLALGGDGKWPAAVARQLKGIVFLALDRIEHVAGTHRYYRTINGRYVRAEHVRRTTAAAMHGVLLTRGDGLPLAFVHGGERPLYCTDGRGSVERCGSAAKHARFAVRRELQLGERALVSGPGGVLVERGAVRIAARIARPRDVPAGERWVHVDLSEQTLVAYEGDDPVFATLISGGTEGREAPRGTFRVRAKHVTATMRGPDAEQGSYEVAEVPWTLFYHGGYAIHGAYWHDDFGKPRSHGCTNLAPVDARWLFYWTEPALAAGKHSAYSRKGTRLVFTR